jgi:hypothetical protein
MRFLVCLFCFALGICNASLFAQTNGEKENTTDEPTNFFVSNLVWGSSLGFQFGSITFIDVSPMVGYPITKRFIAGIGGSYRFYRQRPPNPGSPSFRANILGGSAWTRFYIFENLYAHAEYEMLRIDLFGGSSQLSYLKSTALIGAGYQQRYGERVTGFMTLLFPFYTSETRIELYRIPVVRFGFLVNLPPF